MRRLVIRALHVHAWLRAGSALLLLGLPAVALAAPPNGVARCESLAESLAGRETGALIAPTVSACLARGLASRTEVEANFLALLHLALGTAENQLFPACQPVLEQDLAALGCDPASNLVCRTNLLNLSRQRSVATLAQYEAYRARVAPLDARQVPRPLANLSIKRALLNAEQRGRAERLERRGTVYSDTQCNYYLGPSPADSPLPPLEQIEDDSFRRARSVHDQLVKEFEDIGYAPRQGRCELGFPGMDRACLSLSQGESFFRGGAPSGPYYETVVPEQFSDRLDRRARLLARFAGIHTMFNNDVSGAPNGNLSVTFNKALPVSGVVGGVLCPAERELFGLTRLECLGFSTMDFGISFNRSAQGDQRLFAASRPGEALPLCVDQQVVGRGQSADPDRCAENALMDANRQCRELSGLECLRFGRAQPTEEPDGCALPATTDFIDCDMPPFP